MGHVTGMGQMGNGDKILIEKPEGKRSLGRPRHWSEDSGQLSDY